MNPATSTPAGLTPAGLTPERWRRIEELFRTVIDLPAVEREAYLTGACGGDDELRREVLSLIARDTNEDTVFDPILGAALSLTAEPKDDLTGERIGPYRLTRLVGRGGMGAVYEAERDDPQFDQQVAIKIIKRGMDTEFARDRFLRERRILASLDHPHIARLFDGGATPDGRPYFVMEFVAGEPITEYCRRRLLPLDEKLKLFRDVCSAVQHAHRNLIVHRDLKPGNILVTEDGSPKLLDFGIAKLLAPDPQEAVTQTETAVRMMTPDYASPEQARGLPVTTATDVYSLGVVLFEMLTGSRPHQFKSHSPSEIERAICDTETEKPSVVVSRTTGAPARLARQLTGDLDNIVLMAMRKEPERRYQSVEQLSEDIRRHLEGLPVIARKDTFSYRAGKFARRHKAVVAMLAMLALLAVAMTVQAALIARERDRANQEAATAEAVTRSLVALFELADPRQSGGSTITARELLDRGAEKVVHELKDQPEVQARLMDTIGQLYKSIGAYDQAKPLHQKALEIRRRTLGQEHPDVAASLNRLADVAYLKGDYAGSEALFREALEMRRKLLGNESVDVAKSLNGLASALRDRGKLEEAEPIFREALAMRLRLLGEGSTEVAESLNNLGRLLSEQGKLDEVESLYRRALATRRKLFGDEHPLVATNLNNLASILHDKGDYQGAEPLFQEALKIRRKLLGEEHPEVAISLGNLASLLQDKGDYDEAERLYRRALEIRRKLFGDEHPRVTITMNNLATLLQDRKDYDGAESLFRRALEMRRKLLGEEHPEVATSLNNLALLLYDRGEYSGAERLYRQAIDTYHKSLKPDHWMINRSRSNLGACLMKLKRYGEAEEQLLAGYSGLKSALGERHAHTQKTISRLIELYELRGAPDKAEPYRALFHIKEKASGR